MIRLDALCARAGSFALREVNMEIPAGGYAALMGRTGAGKTTLVEVICGLRAISAGRIHLGGRDVTTLRPGERGIGYVPQDGALFPGMTVAAHLAFAPRVHGWRVEKTAARVEELAGWLQLGHLLERKPAGLSGGEIQRVALGRALAVQPQILCMDEPLSSLDEATREDMHTLLTTIRQHTGATIMHVTHSRAEALRLADVFFQMENGTVRRES